MHTGYIIEQSTNPYGWEGGGGGGGALSPSSAKDFKISSRKRPRSLGMMPFNAESGFTRGARLPLLTI